MKFNCKKLLLCLSAPALGVAALTGCRGTGGNSKTTIFIEPFSGSGFGYQWIVDLAKEWKETTDYPFEISVSSSSIYMASAQLPQIESGISKTDVFFGAEPDYKEGIYRGWFEDLSDLLTAKPDGTQTIQDKILDWDTWQKVAAKNTYNKTTGEFGFEGCYLLPYTVTLCGLVFDYDSFLEKGLLIAADASAEVKAQLDAQGLQYEQRSGKLYYTADGRQVTRAGRDGKFNTYDDGQPETLAEYASLLTKLQGRGTPYVYSIQGNYLDSYILAQIGQRAGLDTYDAIVKFDSNGKQIDLYNGTKEVITWENGYKAYQAKDIEESIQYVYDNFYANRDLYKAYNYVDGSQSAFINGLIDDSNFFGLINEGNWFENEASALFASASKKGGKEFGKYDLRYLLNPVFDGQKGLDGNGNGSCMSAPEYGAITVRKQSDPLKLEAIKSFLTFMLKNENLAKVNAKTGLIWGYNYDIPEEISTDMTLFQKTCYTISHDLENVKVLSHRTDRLSAPFVYASRSILSSTNALPVANEGTVVGCLAVKKTVSDIVTKIRGNYSARDWANVLDETKEQLS